MSVETGREGIDEKRPPRHMVERLTPAAKPGPAGELSALSPSRESAGPSAPTVSDAPCGPRVKVEQAPPSVPPARLRRLGDYGLALLFVAAAALVRWTLPEVLSPAPTLVFYLAWVGAAAFGGLGPGLLATLASWLCINLFFDSTPGRIDFTGPIPAGRLLILLAGGVLVSIVGEKMRRGRIRERRQAAELAAANTALHENEEKYCRLFVDDLTGDFLATPAGRVVEANPAFAAIYGFANAAGAVAYDISRFNPQDWVDLVTRVQKERIVPGHESLHRRLDGTEIWVVANVAGRFSETGELTAIQGYVFDDTQRKRAAEALRELNATLENSVAQRTAELEQRARQLQRLTLELTKAEEQERKRLAEILHDDLQQMLAAAKFHLSVLHGRVKDDAGAQEIAAQVRDLLGDAIGKSRGLSHELSSPALAQGDVAGAFESLAEQMQTQHGLTVRLDLGERVELSSEPLRVLLYRAAQELLFNVVKHAGVREATLRLRRRRGRIWLSVSDKGRGFDPAEAGHALGFGLVSIRERIGLLGGRLKIKSAIGKGSTFVIAVPDSDTREPVLSHEAPSAQSGVSAPET
jgi:PAS domain S-box-containing protein